MAKFTKPKPLNPNQKEFLRNYLLLRNATEAYRLAYPKSKNPTVDSANLMKNPLIQEAINKNAEKLQKKFEITEEKIISELIKCGFDEHMPAHIGDVVNWDEEDNISLVPKEQMKKTTLKYIKSLKQVIGKDGSRGVAVEMRQFDKVKALKTLREHIGVWRPKDGTAGGEGGENTPGTEPNKDTGEAIVSRVSGIVEGYIKRK